MTICSTNLSGNGQKLVFTGQSHFMSTISKMSLMFEQNLISLIANSTQSNYFLRCGNGIRERTREHQLPGKCTTLDNFTCRHSKKQQEWCNMGCSNGETPSQSGCNCRLGYHGNCCQFGRGPALFLQDVQHFNK